MTCGCGDFGSKYDISFLKNFTMCGMWVAKINPDNTSLQEYCPKT